MTIMEPRKHGDASDGMIGGRHSRFEGTVKVTGAATYALEYPFENLAHAVLLQSTIPAGRVLAVDTAQAKAMPGVLLVLTPEDDFGLKVASDWYGIARKTRTTIPCHAKFASMARPSALLWQRRGSKRRRQSS